MRICDKLLYFYMVCVMMKKGKHDEMSQKLKTIARQLEIDSLLNKLDIILMNN
jgi:hypothetical protein